MRQNILYTLLSILVIVKGSFKIVDSDLFPQLIHFRSADFGYIPYGKLISGDLVAYEQNSEGCISQDNPKLANNFLFVKYGKCSIFQKALIAQKKKVKMLIVIADHDYIDEVHILNTGVADEVKIPVLLFEQTIGLKIYNEITEKKQILEGKCFFPRDVVNEGPVNVDYWFDPLDSSNYRIHLALSFSQLDGSYFTKTQSCVSHGKYCGHNPENFEVLKGRDVVLTGLAMLCLQNQNASVRLTQTLIQFDKMCLIKEGRKLQNPLKCLSDVAKENNYQETDFEKDCFAKHFESGDLEYENQLLNSEKTLFELETVQIWPELYVNQRAIRGNIQSIDEVESAVCAGYSTDIPEPCYEYFEYSDDTISVGFIILMVLLSASVMFGILFAVFKFYYHKKFKEQIDGEVNNVIQKYMSFNDETDNS